MLLVFSSLLLQSTMAEVAARALESFYVMDALHQRNSEVAFQDNRESFFTGDGAGKFGRKSKAARDK